MGNKIVNKALFLIFIVYFDIKLVLSQYNIFKQKIMATAIATIPVLTGEVAERFEMEAQATYKKSLSRTENEKREIAEHNRRGLEMVRTILAKSKLD